MHGREEREADLPRVLNVGCGKKKLPNALNADISPIVSPDIVLDVNRRPWPLPDGWFEEVHAYDVVEHIEDVVSFFEEVHRICSPGAIVHITVPHYSCSNAFTDPTHRHYFGLRSFDYVTGEHEHDHYTSVRFEKQCVMPVFSHTLVNKIVWRAAAKFPQAWEDRWAWMFPAWFIFAKLRVVK
jgi:hypothetical protein